MSPYLGLRDHFRPPLSTRRHWHAFHNGWATFLAEDLNDRLPPGFFAEPNVQFGIEIDIAAFEEGVTTEAAAGWGPPPATQTIALPVLTDWVEVAVYDMEAGPVLAGAIELVSPSNKDREAHREAFLAKCQSYLQQGVGLVIVDIVTTRAANFHDALLARLDPAARASGAGLYAASFRPVERQGETQLDVWCEPMAVGSPLPESPLWLRRACCLPVALQATYDRTCRAQRID